MKITGWITGEKKARQAVLKDDSGIFWFSTIFKKDKDAKERARQVWPDLSIKWVKP